MRPRRVNTPGDLEGVRIKLERRDASELVAIRIVNLVVIDLPIAGIPGIAGSGGLAEDPPRRTKIRLRWLALNGIA